MAATFFQRYLLPGFAFKAVVIGGGYATGRELAEFFLPSGPRGGLLAMLLATAIWSTVCVLTFTFARLTASTDYKTFFRALLGPAWPLFELAYILFVILILSVFGAAAGAIGAALFGLPPIAGTLALAGAIAGVVAYGNTAVERLFKYVTYFLYAVYVVFVVLALSTFGDQVTRAFAQDTPTTGWFTGGVTYAGYNVVGAVVILPVIRHFTGNRDAVIAGMLAGPFAMLPAFLFFICMAAFYPGIGAEALPSDVMLSRLNIPLFRVFFEAMIFLALLESGAGAVHAINERIAHVYTARTGRMLTHGARLGIALSVLVVAIFAADRFGLIALIAKGYTALAYVILAVFVLPLVTLGAWRVVRGLPNLKT